MSLPLYLLTDRDRGPIRTAAADAERAEALERDWALADALCDAASVIRMRARLRRRDEAGPSSVRRPGW